MDFKRWLLAEAKAPWVYHVTQLYAVPSIMEHGLDSERGVSQLRGTSSLDGMSKAHVSTFNPNKGNFFSDQLRQVFFWTEDLWDNIKRWHKQQPDSNFVTDKEIPIILRFRFNRNPQGETPKAKAASDPEPSWNVKRIGEGRWGRDALAWDNDFYTDRVIPPKGLTMWDGERWGPLKKSVDLPLFVSMGGDGAPEPKDYPYPPLSY